MADQKLTGVAGVKTPKLNMMNKDPVTKSILGILTPEENKPKNKTGASNSSTNKDQISKATLERISKITSTTIDANRELMESVPGAFKALSILQAAILSPRDLTTINLSYTSETYEGRNNDLNTMLLDKVKDYVENNYKITDRLQDIVADILFYKGGRAIALLSSSALDNVINGHVRASMEALEEEYKDGEFINRGWLGDNDATIAKGTRRASLESLISGEVPPMADPVVADSRYNITVTDNDSILRLPQLKLMLARNAMSKKVRIPRGLRGGGPTRSYGIEALDDKGKPKQKDGSRNDVSIAKKLNEEQYVGIYNQLFKTRDYQQTDLVEIRRDDELTMENVDAVLWTDLPFESVVPVHLPGNPRARIGAYVLLDGDGNPLSTAEDENQYQDIQQNKMDTANAIDGTKGIIEMAQEYKNGSSDQFSMVEFRRKINEEIERDLVQRIVNGTFAQKVALGMTDEIKQMMFARTLRNLKTKVLFLPEESLVYFAFDYNRFGIGRSLLERSRLYASMAMANVISTTLANISASANVTTLGINLDPDNPEPDATVETIVTTHLNSNRTMSSLIGARNPRDVINIMDEAGVIVKTSGHPGYPDIDVDVSYDKRNVTPPDAEWNDRLLEMLWNMWGVDPALLSSQNNTQFAIEHINNNALFRKSTGMQRNMLCATLSELVQKIVAKSGNLMNDLYAVINDNKKLWIPTSKKGKEQLKELKEDHPEIDNNDQSLANFILVNFINSIELTLPEPMEGDIDEQNRAYDTMRQRYENSFKDLFTDDVLAYILGEGADTGKFEVWRQNLVAHKMREWMAGSGSYSDITDLCKVDDESNASITLLASMVAYNEKTLGAIAEYLKLSNKMKDKIRKSFDKLEENGDLDNNPAENGFGDNGADQFDENGNPIGGDSFDNPGGDGGGADFGGAADSIDGTDAGAGEGGDAGDFGDVSGEGGIEGDGSAEAAMMSTDADDADPMTSATEEGTEGGEDNVDPMEAAIEGEPLPAEASEDDLSAGGEETNTDGEEPLLDENGNPIETSEEGAVDGEGTDPLDIESAGEGEDGTEATDVEGGADASESEEGNDDTLVEVDDNAFEEDRQDENSGMDFEENQQDDGDLDFEEDQSDDGTMEFEEGNGGGGNGDLDFEETGDAKPKGRDRKSKRTQKKEAKKKKESKDSGDGLDFGKV